MHDDAAQRLLRLADDAATQTTALRARARDLQRSLDMLAQELSKAQDGAWVPPAAVQQPHTQEPAQTVASAEVAAAAPADDPARLIAIEMAISGSSRSEVARRLTIDFTTADPRPILDDIFGAGSDDATRRPWNT